MEADKQRSQRSEQTLQEINAVDRDEDSVNSNSIYRAKMDEIQDRATTKILQNVMGM